jgi:hypothetical protein
MRTRRLWALLDDNVAVFAVDKHAAGTALTCQLSLVTNVPQIVSVPL